MLENPSTRKPRKPSPDDRVDQRWAAEQAAKQRHADRLKRALDAFAKAAMEVQAANPGAIGRRAAEQRARECRAAVNETVKTFVRRERLDAHAHSIQQIVAYLASLDDFTATTPAEVELVHSMVDDIGGVLSEFLANTQAQRAAMDEQART